MKKLLVVYKKSTYRFYSEKGSDALDRYMHENDGSLDDLKENDAFHYEALDRLLSILPEADVAFRADINSDKISCYDSLVSVGGDGTILDISHHVFDGTPILGINSTFGAKMQSEGYFCGATRLDIEEKIDALMRNRLNDAKLSRMQTSIDNIRIKELALNDILICHSIPASMSRYEIEVGADKEFQRSSGIWVSTGAGSTAAMTSASGSIFPVDSNKIEYLVREPAKGIAGNFSLLNGFSSEMNVVSRMRNGKLYLDGSHISYDFSLGSRLNAKISDNALTILGFPNDKNL